MLACLQDAEIGDQYDEFPAVLQLHLKRFEYDFERDIRVKVWRTCSWIRHSMCQRAAAPSCARARLSSAGA